MRHFPTRLAASLLLLVATLLLSSCAVDDPTVPAANAANSTPTLSPLFQEQPTAVVTPTLPAPPPTARPARAQPNANEQFDELPIFDDQLADNWSLDGSKGMLTNLAHAGYAKAGLVSIAATPLQAEGQLQLSVMPTTQTRYQRDKVLGISFWLSGGKNSIAPEDLGVAVLGSNAFPYWDANDTSVKLEGRVTDGSPLFSETRLYYLQVNNAIPPETWIKITVWLDDLQYDPLYTYVTGFYIKSDKNFRDTFYIDQVRLLVQQ